MPADRIRKWIAFSWMAQDQPGFHSTFFLSFTRERHLLKTRRFPTVSIAEGEACIDRTIWAVAQV